MVPITILSFFIGLGLQIINVLTSESVHPDDLGAYGQILEGFRSLDRTVSTVNLLNPISLVGGAVSGFAATFKVIFGLIGLLTFDLHFFGLNIWGLMLRSVLTLLSCLGAINLYQMLRGSA